MRIYYLSPVNSVNQTELRKSDYFVSMYTGYSDFTPRQPLYHPDHSENKRPRQAITKFSPRARKGMLKSLFSLSEYPSLFVTLTYPSYYPADSKEWKRHLDNFFRNLRRDFNKAWFFWKLEPQKRGAPHYHLIGELGEEANIVLFRKYISELWFRICGTEDPKHLRAGTQVLKINDSYGKMKAYVCKYVGKAQKTTKYSEWEYPGRFWGIFGRNNLPLKTACFVQISNNQFCRIKRIIIKWLKNLSPASKKYSLRLKQIPSFHLLIHHRVLREIIEHVTGKKLPPLSMTGIYTDLKL